jgi:hypothetical protein
MCGQCLALPTAGVSARGGHSQRGLHSRNPPTAPASMRRRANSLQHVGTQSGNTDGPGRGDGRGEVQG